MRVIDNTETVCRKIKGFKDSDNDIWVLRDGKYWCMTSFDYIENAAFSFDDSFVLEIGAEVPEHRYSKITKFYYEGDRIEIEF